MLPLCLEKIIMNYVMGMELHDEHKAVIYQMRQLQLVRELNLIFSCCYQQNNFVVTLCLILIAELNREKILYTD